MASLQYRPDIDGLRALSVISVLLFHADIEFLSGGFVGVDVFFVISGFLITRLIYHEVERGAFSFSNFYVRRARRLFPALFFTLLVSMVLAAIFFYPHHLERFGGSMVHAILSLSNFYFWGEAGYFDAGVHFKPLLHTWSLSVEEQFYLFWPAVFFFLLTRKNKWLAPIFIVVIGIVSYFASSMYIDSDPEGAFYLAPFRAYEFSIGAIMVWLGNYEVRKNIVNEAILLIGLGLIIYPMFSYSSATEFPGFNALIPCVGAALVIFSGKALYCGQLLCNKVMVGCGLISYSLYLVHWPFIVFYQYISDRESLGPKSVVLVVVGSIVVAIFMYFFVEKPFRKRPSSGRRFSAPAFGLGCTFCSMLLLLPAAHAWGEDGWGWRYPVGLAQAIGDPIAKRTASWQTINVRNSSSRTPFSDGTHFKLLVIGDSHSKDVFNALHFLKKQMVSMEVKRFRLDDSCFYATGGVAAPSNYRQKQKNMCHEQAEKLKKSSFIANADTVILSARWESKYIEWVPGMIRYINSQSSAKVVVMGRTAEFEDVPILLFRNGEQDNYKQFLALNRNRKLDSLNKKLAALSVDHSATFLDKVAFICNEKRNECDVFDDEGNVLYYDYGHWTVEGAKYFGQRMLEEGYVSQLIDRRL